MSYAPGKQETGNYDQYAAENPKNENPGIVASDSLAAESIQEGGSFGANSDSRGPMDQPARSLNANTTDTSNATKLDPAVDAEARQSQSEWSEASQQNAGRQLGKDSQVGETFNVTGGFAAGTEPSSGSGGNSGGNSGSYGNSGSDGTSGSDEYAEPRPKGQNITEGGFDSSAPNASYNTDIGGRNDPGRAALDKMEADNVPVPTAGTASERQEEITNDGQFDSLGETSA